MSAPRFHRVAAGDYETADGQFRLVQLDGGATRAWNVEYGNDWVSARVDEDPEHVTPYDFDLIIDGAATKRDALALFAVWYTTEREVQR